MWCCLRALAMNSSRSLKRNVPGVRHALHDVVPGVLERRQPRRVRAAARRVRARRRRAAERACGRSRCTRAERVEGALLRARAALRGAARLGLERAVHALVRAVLLRLAPGRMRWCAMPEAQPPHVQLRQARARPWWRTARRCRSGSRAGRPVGAERALQHAPRVAPLVDGRPAAVEQVARVLVGERERVAVDAVARAELAP
jgi:hypothetical protein